MDTITNLFRARKTVLEMLFDRGYILDEPSVLEYNFDTFKSMYHSNKIDIHIVNSDKEIYVKFITVFKIKPNTIRDILTTISSTLFTMDKHRIIIVLLSKPNNTILKIKNEKYKNVEFFWLNRLIINITHHQYVPKHEKVKGDTAVSEIIKKYNLSTVHQLPLLDKNDPISRYYNYQSGDICKITRKNRISGISILYRLVK